LAFTLALTLVLLYVVLSNGLGVFWPDPIYQITLHNGETLLGEIVESEKQPARGIDRIKIKVGNRENGAAFRWVDRWVDVEDEPETTAAADGQTDATAAKQTRRVENITQMTRPEDAFKLDRMKNLNYFGFLKEIQASELPVTLEGTLQDQLAAAMASAHAVEKAEIKPIQAEESIIESALNSEIQPESIELTFEKKQLQRQMLASGKESDPAFATRIAAIDSRLAELGERETELKEESYVLSGRRTKADATLRSNVAVFVDSHGREQSIPLIDIVRFTCPNQMDVGAKIRHYGAKIWEMLWDDPREANQDGGLFPAIFGTVLLVFLMAITCFPLGVLAGIYLGEYAKEGPLVRLVRVAVNNLAGIPSIVYGIFGLGFFIYLCGGALDDWLFPAWVDAGKPVFGQGCIFWASLTLGLLTIPVVIVSTEEALMAIPRDVRESSYALGSTKFQTLVRILVPMASPGMMTGFILAMARAAGEVAPLMITGAVKSAPVPMDGAFPFIRLDRQFMHLGFHIFDISCKSPNVEATKPMVYVTTLLLLLIVLSLTSLAIWLRNRMRKRYELRTI
jgi:phosphate transport system permease protein